MLYVSIFVELLRSRPSLAVWLAALAQGLLWLLVPSLFYAGPPGDVPDVLAVGHEFQLGTQLGPPLAFWVAEIAFDLTAGRSFARDRVTGTGRTFQKMGITAHGFASCGCGCGAYCCG